MCQDMGSLIESRLGHLCELPNELARQCQQDSILVSHHQHMKAAAQLLSHSRLPDPP